MQLNQVLSIQCEHIKTIHVFTCFYYTCTHKYYACTCIYNACCYHVSPNVFKNIDFDFPPLASYLTHRANDLINLYNNKDNNINDILISRVILTYHPLQDVLILVVHGILLHSTLYRKTLLCHRQTLYYKKGYEMLLCITIRDVTLYYNKGYEMLLLLITVYTNYMYMYM